MQWYLAGARQECVIFDRILLQVFDWFNEISGEDGGRPEKPEKPKAYITQSGEDVETDGEGIKLFNCARYAIHAILSLSRWI